jgi:hypothetical protein
MKNRHANQSMLCIEKKERKTDVHTHLYEDLFFIRHIYPRRDFRIIIKYMISSQEISSNIIHKKNNLRASYNITLRKKQYQTLTRCLYPFIHYR